MRILIRADSEYKIGSGHVYRSMNLANKLCKNNSVFFYTISDKNKFYNKKIDKKINLIFLKKEKKYNNVIENKIIIKILKKLINIDFIIIDSNKFSYNPSNNILKNVNKIFQLNDIITKGNRNRSIINPNFVKKTLNINYKYSFLGPKYSLVKKPTKSFISSNRIKKIKCINFFFGNSDTKNITFNILNLLLNKLQDKEINVIIGKNNINKNKIIERFNNNKNINIFYNVKNIFKILSKSDIAFGSPSFTQSERMAIGLPTLLISANNEQLKIAKTIDKLGYGFNISDYKKLNSYYIKKKCMNIVNNFDKINKSKFKMLADLNHDGLQNIENILKNSIKKKN